MVTLFAGDLFFPVRWVVLFAVIALAELVSDTDSSS